MRAALDAAPEALILDLGPTTFIDSTGVSEAVRALRQAEDRGVRLVVLPGPPHVQRVFEVCGLDAVLPFAG